MLELLSPVMILWLLHLFQPKPLGYHGGAAGVDEQSIEAFEQNLKNNLYQLWNRLSSGSYFPPAVKAVSIRKKSGGIRILGVPTVSDRIAQTVVKLVLEPILEPVFDEDSYGYRPGRSALDAVAVTRKRCWYYDWVVEFDISGLFDNIRHDLLMKALRRHCDCRWVSVGYVGSSNDSSIKRDGFEDFSTVLRMLIRICLSIGVLEYFHLVE